jgi:hypothetical protein
MPKFRKKPVVVDAIRWLGHNGEEIANFIGEDCYANLDDPLKPVLIIETLEGQMLASPGDWIIKGVTGEFYPCKPDIFEATYEAA